MGEDLQEAIWQRADERYRSAQRWGWLHVGVPIFGASTCITSIASAALGASPNAIAFWGALTLGALAIMALMPLRQNRDVALKDCWKLEDLGETLSQDLAAAKTRVAKQKILEDYQQKWKIIDRRLPMKLTAGSWVDRFDDLSDVAKSSEGSEDTKSS